MNDGIAQYIADTLKGIEKLLFELVRKDRAAVREEPLQPSDLRPPRDIYNPDEKL